MIKSRTLFELSRLALRAKIEKARDILSHLDKVEIIFGHGEILLREERIKRIFLSFVRAMRRKRDLLKRLCSESIF